MKPWEYKPQSPPFPQPGRTAKPTPYDRLRACVEAGAWVIPSVDRLREFFTLAERGDESVRTAIEVYLEHPRVREELEASS